VGLSPETCRVKTFAKNKPQLLHLVGIIFTINFNTAIKWNQYYNFYML